MTALLSLRVVSEQDALGRLVLPKSQARPRFGNRRAYSPKTGWYHLVKWEGMKVAPPQPLDGPLSLIVTFIFPRPKTYPAVQVYKWTKPDADNLIKAVKDALTQARWWVDDSRVAQSLQIKRYVQDGELPGAAIEVLRLVDPAWVKKEARAC